MRGRATMNDDVRYMERALELAKNGYAAPNPHVGCVIVKDGVIVGEGHSAPAGGPHAEIRALEQAKERALGSTVYVTLEPCNHQGRTGPCSEALIQAGVKRVVYGVEDPNPRAKGGAQRLIRAGIDVENGVLAEKCVENLKPFLTAMKRGRPWVTVKTAMTMDGKIAWPNGESKWITGPEAREDGHRYRVALGSVLVGRRTVEFDDPRLTARIEGELNQPLRVVLDPSGKLDETRRVFHEEGECLWLVNPESVTNKMQTGLLSFDVESILRFLRDKGQTGVLVEGGAGTVRRFFEADLVDELVLYMAPKLFGDGMNWLGLGAAWLPDGK